MRCEVGPDGGEHADQNRERAVALRTRFIDEKDPASLVESSKLFLNQTDDAFYQDYLVQIRPPLNPRGLPKSNRLLWECFRYFTKRLDEPRRPRVASRLRVIPEERQVTRKLIEVAKPLDAINKAPAREKSIRNVHRSTLHLMISSR